jgi:hypothetical protein
MGEHLVGRRGFLGGAGALFLCAPAIVRAASIMPVSAKALGPATLATTTFEIWGSGATTWWGSPFDGVCRGEYQQWQFDGVRWAMNENMYGDA